MSQDIGITTRGRSNRPSVDGNTLLEFIFTNAGAFVDPLDVSSVTLFLKSDNVSPCTVLDADQLISDDVSSNIRMNWEGVVECDDYVHATNFSSIVRFGEGHYGVVLTPGTSGYSSRFDQSYDNGATAVCDYTDVWTVKHFDGSDYTTHFADFHLFNDTFVGLTEFPMLRPVNDLSTRKIELGSRRDLKVTTNYTIENEAYDENLRNLLRNSIVGAPQFRITKKNRDRNLDSRVEVSGFADTSGLVKVTSFDTMIFTWDTEELKTHPKLLDGSLGSMIGNYEVVVRYTVFNELIYSPPFILAVK